MYLKCLLLNISFILFLLFKVDHYNIDMQLTSARQCPWQSSWEGAICGDLTRVLLGEAIPAAVLLWPLLEVGVLVMDTARQEFRGWRRQFP